MNKKKTKLKATTRINNWIEAKCPYCDNNNWLGVGDLSDCTESDMDAIKCWSCKKTFLLIDDQDLVDVRGGDDNLNVDNGLSSPLR